MLNLFAVDQFFLSKFYWKVLVLLILFSMGYSMQLHANNLDSLVQLRSKCTDVNTCYSNTLDLCRTAAVLDDPSLDKYVKELCVYMDSIDRNPIWVEGLTIIGEAYRNINAFSEADSIFKVALKYCTSEDDLYNINIHRARVKQRLGQPLNGLIVLDSLLEQLNPKGEVINRPRLYLSYGLCSQDAENVADAIKSYLKVIELSGDDPRYATAKYQAELYLDQIYLYYKSYESIQELHQKTLKQAQESGDHMGELFAIYPIIASTIELENFDQTIAEGHKAIKLKNEHNVSTAFGYIYQCMATAFIDMNQLDSASYYLEKGIELSRESNENKELADNLVTKVRLLMVKGQYKEAIPLAKEAMSLRNYHDETLFSYYATIQDKLGNHKEAYETLKSNWDNWETSKADEEHRMITSVLIEDRLKILEEQQEKEFKHQIDAQRLIAIIASLLIFLLMVAGFLYMQLKNTAKLNQLNNSLTQHNEALEQFAHITSHDLKEPIRNISSYSELLMKKSRKNNYDKVDQEYVQFIQSSSKNLYRMVESLKKFTEVSFSKQKSEKVNIKEVLEVVDQNLSQFIDESNAVINYNNPESIEFVMFPKELLILVFQNLIQNGIKHNNSEVPQIDITVTQNERKTSFEIKDNGIGIEDRFHNQIFVPFKTLRNKYESKSSGLGLTICKNIIENHGGKIWLESDGESGSRFHFTV